MVTMPVFKEKRQVAVLGIPLNIESLSRRLKETYGLPDREVIVLDRMGEVILNTKSPGRTVGIDLTQKEGTFLARGPDRVERLYSFTTTRHGWKVITGLPLSIVKKEVLSMSRRFILVILLLGTASITVALVFSRRLKRGFDLLIKGIKEMEKGDYSSRIPVKGSDEIARLSRSFNEFGERLSSLHKALVESEEFYHCLIENSSDIILMTNPEGFITYASPSVQQLGYNASEVRGRSIFEFLDPIYAPEVKRRIDEAIKSLEFQSTTVRVFHRNGSLRLLSAKGKYLKDKGSLVINCSDITEWARNENLINDILGSISEGFLILDRDYRIISANRSYLEKLRTDIESIKGKYCWQVSHRQNEPCYLLGELCPVKEAFKTGEPFIAVHTHVSSTGEPVYVEIRAYPQKDLSGRITGAIETMIDLTEQKRLEAQLRQAQKLEAIGQLAGGVANDFNNILTAVSGYGSLLDMKLPPDSPLKEYVSEILKAVERGSNLAKGLLAFSRKQPGNPKAVDLNDIVKLIIKLLTKLIREDIRIETRLSEEELIIMADSGHIEQIIMNLATNARDAMPEGGVLTIKTEKVYIDERFRDIHGYGKPGNMPC
jgi:PAS domain S-box-containing protein